MNEFHQFVCWTEKGVLASTPRDAANLSSGHFRAVHHPLRLKRRRLEAQSGGKWVEEYEIIKVLEGPLRSDGYLLVPIVGGSGTGKSHLVRWVYEHTRDRKNWVVRYVPKNRTSIRRAIEIVIDGMQGPAIESAREALESAPAHTESEHILADRLLDELALITAEEGQRNPEHDQHSEQRLAKLRSELPDVLRDPVVRRRLTADGAAIPRLVGLAMKGRHDNDGLDDDAIRVAEDDLPVKFEEMDQVSRRAQKLLLQLGTISDLAAAAIELINEALPIAVKRVFVSSQVDLIEVFRDVRKALLAENKELVLFVEDLTVLHGVEREFLDAIVEPATTPGEELCKLRILFAVTEGHFDALDTVRTRCDDAYRLDARYGSDGVDLDEAASFLGRYLNACRLDPVQLERDWDSNKNDKQVSNACDDCNFQIVCHEAFGVSAEGIGLYPFNLSAVDKLVASLSVDRFDPRVVVRELVNRFLLMGGSDISRGEFPSDDLLGNFDKRSDPVDPLTVADLRSKRPNDYTRLVNVFRYWSEDGLDVGDSILNAVGLTPLERVESVGTGVKPKRRSHNDKRKSKDESETSVGEALAGDRLQSQSQKVYNALTHWSGNHQDLGAAATQHLRKLIHKAVIQNLRFGPMPVNLGKEFERTRFDVGDIYLTGSVTDQGNPDRALVVIEQDSSSAAALQGLVLINDLPDGGYPGENRFRQEVGRHLEEWTRAVMSELQKPLPPFVVEAVHGLVVCSAIFGNCENAKEPSDHLEALFAGPNETCDYKRSQKWQTLIDDAKETYGRLEPIIETYFGEARGTGSARAIRADLLLEIIQAFTKGWELTSSDPAIERLMRSVTPALDAEWGLLEERVKSVTPLLDADRSWREQASRVLELIDDAHQAGRLSDSEAKGELTALVELTEDDSHRLLFRAAEIMDSDLPLSQRLAMAASELPPVAAAVSTFVARAQHVMDDISSDLEERRSERAGHDDLEDVVQGVLAAASRLDEALNAVSP